jgi:hypothetical protein
MRRFTLPIACGILMLGAMGWRAFAAPQTDAHRSLDAVLPDLKFDNVTISDALDFLRDASGANIHVNWRAIEEIGIGKDTTINVRLRNIPLRKVLRMVLSEVSSDNLLTYYIEDNVIEITTHDLADKQLITKVYPIEDLLMEVPDFDQPPTFNLQTSTGGRGGGSSGNLFGSAAQQGAGQTTKAQRAQQLIDTIEAIVHPELWNTSGGPAAIRYMNGALIVTAPRSIHEALGGYSD